jgi:hypothetical protein
MGLKRCEFNESFRLMAKVRFFLSLPPCLAMLCVVEIGMHLDSDLAMAHVVSSLSSLVMRTSGCIMSMPVRLAVLNFLFFPCGLFINDGKDFIAS